MEYKAVLNLFLIKLPKKQKNRVKKTIMLIQSKESLKDLPIMLRLPITYT